MPGHENYFKTLVDLLRDYTEGDLSDTEYVERKVFGDEHRKIITQKFLTLLRHRSVFENIAEHFCKLHRLRIGTTKLSVLLYIIIFDLCEDNFEDIFKILGEFQWDYLPKLWNFLIEDENLVAVAQIACRIFENVYVLEKIVSPLVDKQELIKRLKVELEIKYNEKYKRTPTVQQEFAVAKKKRSRPPPPPSNTPLRWPKFQAKKPPKTTYKKTSIIEKLLEKAYEENRKKSLKILQIAQNVPHTLTDAVETYTTFVSDTPLQKFKARKLPNLRDVEIKGNVTSTLREAKLRVSEQENEIKKIENIIQGGYDQERYEKLEEELRKEQEMKKLEDIERKHLRGLLTYEEAVLAKKKLVKHNQQKTAEFKVERHRLLNLLDEWRTDEQIKFKQLVEKTQEMEKAAKESEKKMQEEKKTIVRLQQFESKQLLKKAYEENQKELDRKMQLIQEIKTLHEVRCRMNVKEFDPTECSNIGLLCEMSIAELQERLAMTKDKMEKELEIKRTCIIKRKEEQRQMIQNLEDFIIKARHMTKSKPVRSDSIKLEESAELMQLRKKLEEKRNLRMGFC